SQAQVPTVASVIWKFFISFSYLLKFFNKIINNNYYHELRNETKYSHMGFDDRFFRCAILGRTTGKY
ncbi:TPA: hypothetical protein ACKUK1_000559, partial [Neisseria gonorrhoeae]